MYGWSVQWQMNNPTWLKEQVNAKGPMVNVTVWPTVMFSDAGKKPLWDPTTKISPEWPGTHLPSALEGTGELSSFADVGGGSDLWERSDAVVV